MEQALIEKKEELGGGLYLVRLKVKGFYYKRGQFFLVQPFKESRPLALFPTEVKGNRIDFILSPKDRPSLELIELLREGESPHFFGGGYGKPLEINGREKTLLVGEGEGLYLLKEVSKGLKDFKILNFEGELPEDLKKFSTLISATSNKIAKEISKICSKEGIKFIHLVRVPILDAEGLCLTCRFKVKNSYRLACVEGPWFEDEGIDWDYLILKEEEWKKEQEREKEEFLKVLPKLLRRKK